MATPFSKEFVRLRAQAGFRSAYQFFRANGGPKVLGCTFSNYLRIERGTNLPQPKRLPLLCSLLRLPLKSEELRRLFSAYFETLLGSAELRDWFLAPFSAAAPPAREAPPSPARQALEKVTRDAARPVSVEQYEAIMATEASYWCYRVLSSTSEARTAGELASMLGLAKRDVEAAARALAKRKVLEALPKGAYRGRAAGEFLVFPESSLIPPMLMRKVFRYNEAMVKRKGALLDVRYCGARADLWKLQGYVSELRESIRALNAYSTTEPSDRSALVFVESRVYKLLDF